MAAYHGELQPSENEVSLDFMEEFDPEPDFQQIVSSSKNEDSDSECDSPGEPSQGESSQASGPSRLRSKSLKILN